MARLQRTELRQPSVDADIAALAASRHGVFSRAEATSAGFSRSMIRHRLDTGRWEHLGANVFRIAGTAGSWRQSLKAACLAWGPDSVVSHRSAAALWGFAGFEPGIVELTVPRGRKCRAPAITHRNALFPPDVTVVQHIAVTTPARTLIDLAGIVSVERVEEALDDALRRRLVSIPLLERRLAHLAGGGGRAGILPMRSMLAKRASSGVPQSVFETRLLRALRRAGLPTPEIQHSIRDAGRLVAIVDFAYPALRVAIEADGYRWHSGHTRWQHDRTRRNRITECGWRVIHVTWRDLHHRTDEVLGTIRRTLENRGRLAR